MISEACFTTKPVYLLKLPGHSPKFDFFYKALLKINRISWFSENIDLRERESFNETTIIKSSIQKMLKKK